MEHPSLETGFWNISSTAKYLNMSVAFLRKAVRQKRIPFARIGNKALRFSKPDLDAWIAASSSGTVNHDGPGR
jgi:excisionase family DNA binding protein